MVKDLLATKMWEKAKHNLQLMFMNWGNKQKNNLFTQAVDSNAR